MSPTTSRARTGRPCSPTCSLRRTLVIAALTLAVGAPLGATTNLLFNPDFDTTVVGWSQDPTATGPIWDVEDRDACTGSGSAFLSGGGPGIGYHGTIGGIPVNGGGTLFVRGEARLILAAAPTLAIVTVLFCISPSCDTSTSYTAPSVLLPFDTWTSLDTMPPLPIPANAQWAFVAFLFRSESVYDVLLDRVFASYSDEVFADDFELGELCRWSGHTGSGP